MTSKNTDLSNSNDKIFHCSNLHLINEIYLKANAVSLKNVLREIKAKKNVYKTNLAERSSSFDY